MQAWRLAKEMYWVLDGEGAKLYGGRWNSIGVAMVYTASHLSLAIVELLVHTDSDILPHGYMAFEIEIPDDVAIETIGTLPSGWDAVSPPLECQMVGDEWIAAGRSLVLAVPSAVVAEETNYLLNPTHPDMLRVRITGKRHFTFDFRLFK